jgi:hypothetical protein
MLTIARGFFPWRAAEPSDTRYASWVSAWAKVRPMPVVDHHDISVTRSISLSSTVTARVTSATRARRLRGSAPPMQAPTAPTSHASESASPGQLRGSRWHPSHRHLSHHGGHGCGSEAQEHRRGLGLEGGGEGVMVTLAGSSPSASCCSSVVVSPTNSECTTGTGSESTIASGPCHWHWQVPVAATESSRRGGHPPSRDHHYRMPITREVAQLVPVESPSRTSGISESRRSLRVPVELVSAESTCGNERVDAVQCPVQVHGVLVLVSSPAP